LTPHNYNTMKKTKKVYALYLSVAFFFSLFSFQKVYATVSLTQIVGEITGLQTGSALCDLVPNDSNTHYEVYGTTTPPGTMYFDGVHYNSSSLTTKNCLGNGYNYSLFPDSTHAYLYFISVTDQVGVWARFNTTQATATADTLDLDLSTHFTNISPTNESIERSPTVTISGDWIISTDDLESLNTALSSPANKIRVRAWVTDIEATTEASIIKVIDYTLPTGYETSTSTTVLFNGSVTGLNYGRNYRLTFNLNGSNYYGLFGNLFNINKSIYFSVGTTTESGHIQQSIASSTEEELNANNYANGYSLSACNPISGDWNVVDCVLSMFIPDTDYTSKKVGQMSNTITNAWPIGYITDFVRIISTSTAGTLTPIDATIPNGIPGAGSHITLNLTGVLDPVLNATTSTFVNSSAPSTDTFFDITNYYWKIVCYVLVILYIVGRVLGSHIFGHTGKHATVKTS